MKYELPPSMMVSPGSIRLASFITVLSVAAPAGTITQAARGLVSFLTKSSMEVAPVAPSPARPLDVVGVQVEHDALMAASHQAAHHVRAHSSQTDHAELHIAPFPFRAFTLV